MTSLDGKKVIFIGNSFVYYGGCVELGGQRCTDNGIFARLCRALGDNTEVTDCTYGGHHLNDFTEEGCKFARKCKGTPCFGSDLLRGLELDSYDVVFFSEAGENHPEFLDDCKKLMSRFKNPKTEFVYLCHTYSHYKNHNYVLDGLSELRKLGVKIADWGLVCYRLSEEIHKFSENGQEYTKESFIKNRGDNFHENPLGGYITALTCYGAITGRSVAGFPVDLMDGLVFSGEALGLEGFAQTHYNSVSDSNFREILSDPAEMLEIQKLTDLVVSESNP